MNKPKAPKPPAFQGQRNRQAISEQLKQLAGLIYVTDPDGVTIEELATDPRLEGVSPHTLRSWQQAGGWTKKRAQMWKAVENKARQRMTTVLATAQTAALRQFLEVRNVVLAHILGERDKEGNWVIMPVAPKSLEGLIKSLIELTEKQFELTNRVGSEMVAAVAGGNRRDPLVPATGRAIEEVRQMARAQTRQRRALREGQQDEGPQPSVDKSGA